MRPFDWRQTFFLCVANFASSLGAIDPRRRGGFSWWSAPELALDDFEARSTLLGAACSMSQEPYDLTQKVSQLTTAPKKEFDPGEKR